ncbi:hypothetical protein AMJ86_02390 [bacterium SM23_57]|nr:MAG: hypothetical protein AMJ86_02390 [bacterium SM23_57]
MSRLLCFKFGIFLWIRWIVLAGLIWVIGCGEQFLAQEYVVFTENAYWLFDGNFAKIEIIETIQGDSTEYTLRISDQNGKPVHARFLGYQGQIYLSKVNASVFGYPDTRFDPPVAIFPHTNRTGDVEVMDAAEIRDWDAKNPIRVRVQVTVLQPLPITLAEMRIDDILRIRINYAYIDPNELPFLAGESEWWFGKNIGLIRYRIGSTLYGELVFSSTMAGFVVQQ